MCGDTQINASELRATLHALKRQTQLKETGLEHQFQVGCIPMRHSQACGVHVHNVEPCPVLCQILEKVSPNPAEARAVTAWRNHKKNRSMEFPPGTSPACLLLHYHMAVHCAQWTDGGWF